MDISHISADDITDVAEMTERLEKKIIEILNGNQSNLAISALISATVNCILAPCKSVEEAFFYRGIVMSVFDSTIKRIKIQRPDSPS
jgi:hypothetical protein